MKKNRKIYNYIDDSGHHKIMTVAPVTADTSGVEVWCKENGEFCGSAILNSDGVARILEHCGAVEVDYAVLAMQKPGDCLISI